MKNERKTVFTIMIEEPTNATVRTNHWSEKGSKGLSIESAPPAKLLLIEGLMIRTDINTSSKRGVIIEPMPGNASSSDSSGIELRPCRNRMNPSYVNSSKRALGDGFVYGNVVYYQTNIQFDAVGLSEVPHSDIGRYGQPR